MAECRRYGLVNPLGLDIDEILQEAQQRWLRPVEICEILRNFKRFRIFPEPAIMPPSGSLFLYDRKVLRYFRKDGHSWRKKKDGKTVKEAHERLKAGSVDVLHCYYAHGEENENFQRRSYWMLEEDLSHIVLVHYLEVEGNRTNFNRIVYSQGPEETMPNSEIDGSVSSSAHQINCQMRTQTIETSLNSAQASEHEDAESECSQQASSGFHSFLELQKPVTERVSTGLSDPHYSMLSSNDYQEKFPVTIGEDLSSLTPADRIEDRNDSGFTYEPQKNISFLLSDNILESSSAGIQSMHLQSSIISSQHSTKEYILKQGHGDLGQIFNDTRCNGCDSRPHIQEEWQRSTESSSHDTKWHMDQNSNSNLVYNVASVQLNPADLRNLTSVETNLEMHTCQSMHNELLRQVPNAQHDFHLKSPSESDGTTLEVRALSAIKHSLFDATSAEGLKKNDSFNRWMSKELGDVNESSHMQSTSGSYWDPVENENVVDGSSNRHAHLETYMLSPSLSHDQLFSIIDFSPNWAYEGSEIKVLVTGRFLKSQEEAEECKWSCMFGEVEVPAEVIENGVLRCHTPPHMAGRVPFYITCSNRLACSEVREFEYRDNCIKNVNTANNHNIATIEAFEMRLGKFLCLSSSSPPNPDEIINNDKTCLFSKISELLTDDNNEWEQMSELILEANFSLEKVQHRLVQKLLKEKLLAWLLQKATEGGKGPSILDEGGQGVIHFAAALGYDWAFLPFTIAGINVNFRDVNGWTALHWAAFCGRERTVATLISLGAFPGALSDPSPKYLSGQAPADLASINGHKGISGYLAESALSAHLSSLNLDKQEGSAAQMPESKVVGTTSEKSATPYGGDLGEFDRLSLKDSLAAVRNATQAAARIHQVFRLQSFQKKQWKDLDCSDDNKLGMLEERALSLISVNKPSKLGGVHDDEPMHAAAAIRIQNKFRSWKGRKDFLIIRQRIVKIQAHVRGHQVRKNYRKITWSVGILEKVILRWRRKGSGLRGFKAEALSEDPKKNTDTRLTKEDDDDFLREGRKQTEERLHKALARVKSMVQYPEARNQYRRLLNVAAEIQETKVVCEAVDSSCEGTTDHDDLIDIEALLDEDTLMPNLYNPSLSF